ncbi:hypothetical protein FRB93_002916 [Tulasnella sp. JGI-2019a]|nr:hypothetical protein FRB93_002916 [Tulasnella sp. JGI-2019a]
MDAIKDLIQQPAFIFRIANMTIGALLIVEAVVHFIVHSFSDIIIGLYGAVFGIALIGLEIYTPPQNYLILMYRYASFMFSFAGRGVFYVFMGTLMINHGTWVWVLGSVIALIGITFLGLEFAKVVELPPSMIAPEHDVESQPVWSAEQDS